MLHRDSLGYVQEIRPGEINWMTAGRGIVHSEKVTDEILASGQRLHGLQTWVALPVESETIEPRFEHYVADGIPAIDKDGAQIRVVIGTAYGQTSPVRTESETLYVEIKLDDGASIELPQAEEVGVFVISGEVSIDDQAIKPGTLAVLKRNAEVTLSAGSPVHVMVCGGATLTGDRIVWWNFVSSSRERLEQAKRDWRDGRFPEVPGEEDFIPLPDS
jgi:redox-sensitive bicupin YhaK (pirin superfamily)